MPHSLGQLRNQNGDLTVTNSERRFGDEPPRTGIAGPRRADGYAKSAKRLSVRSCSIATREARPDGSSSGLAITGIAAADSRKSRIRFN
jgi:hypothetical protein